jgi:predicted small integral membrane protein
MPLPIYENMVNLIVSFPIWRLLIIFMNVAMWEHRTFDSEVFRCAKILCKLSFPIVGLKISSLSTLALNSPNRIFICYLGNL